VEPVPETREAFERLAEVGETGLSEWLSALAERIRAIVPDCVGVSFGALRDGLTFTLVSSGDEIGSLDAVQYLDGGPCIVGAHDADVVANTAQDLLDEGRWQLFARASAAAGIGSTLTLPIKDDGTVVGSLNLYASTPTAFDGWHEVLAEAVGASAIDAITNADLSFRSRLAAAVAPEQIAQEEDVNVVIGMIAAHQRIDVALAAERLHQAAARAGVTEAEAAKAIRDILLPDSWA
jgi:GAF domain-containing protein